MSKERYAVILAIAVLLLSAAVAVASDDSDAASGNCTARVFIGDGTDSGTTELSGSGTTVKALLNDALSGRIEINPNGTVKSLDGKENIPDKKSWNIFQWRPPVGWTQTLATSSGDAYLENGTSYYIYYSDVLRNDKVGYSTPSSFEPESTGYFFIRLVTDYDANQYVRSILTEGERKDGFWISGSGSNIAEALVDACDKMRARGNSGFQLEINDDRDSELFGWLGTFMGLKDDQKTDGLWNNWSQFAWNDSTGAWEYNNWCLGYYDPGVYPYFSIVRQITADDNATAGTDSRPSDVPQSLRNDLCTVRFVDGDGKVIKTERVPYFGSATAPSNPTKSPSGDTRYTFTGWDRSFSQVLSDITVNAQFTDREVVPVKGVAIVSDIGRMYAGDTAKLEVTINPSNATNKSVTWSSSDPSIIEVDNNGRITAKKVGTVTITVRTSDGRFTDSVGVTVSDEEKHLSISSSFVALKKGSSITLVCETNGGDVTWTSDDESVATVSERGVITAKGSPGSTTITASIGGGVEATCEILIIDDDDIDMIKEVDRTGSGIGSNDISKDQMEALVDNGEGFTLRTDFGTVSLSRDILSSIGSDTTLSISHPSKLWGPQESVIGNKVAYEILLSGVDTDDLGGTATVSLPYILSNGEDPGDLSVYCVDFNGNTERFDCEYSNGFVTFETTHFSVYFASSDHISGSGSSDDNTMVYIGAAVAAVIAIVLVAVLAMRRRA